MPRHRPPRGQNPRGGKREGAGRPRGPTAFKHLRDLAQSGTEEAVLTIADMMNDKSNPARLRLAAAKAILERGYGKPRKAEMVEQEDFLTTPDPPDQTLKQAEAAPIAEGRPLDCLKAQPNLIGTAKQRRVGNPFTRGTAPGRARPPHQGSFKRGHPKHGGRKEGTPNAISARARKAIAAAAKRIPRGTSLNRNHWQWVIDKNPLINEARERQGQFTLTGAPRFRSRKFEMKAFCQDLGAVAMRAIQTDQFVDRDLVECLTLLGVRDASEFARFLSIAAPKQSYLTARPHAEEPREAVNPGEYRRPAIPEWTLGFEPKLNSYTPVPLDPALTPKDAHHEVCGSPLTPAPGWDWKFDNEERRYRAIALRPKTPIPEWTQRFDQKLDAMTPVPVDPKVTPDQASHPEYGSPL